MPVLLPEARDLLTAFAHIAIDDRLAEAATDAGLARGHRCASGEAWSQASRMARVPANLPGRSSCSVHDEPGDLRCGRDGLV
jgi:hypothetical protein